MFLKIKSDLSLCPILGVGTPQWDREELGESLVWEQMRLFFSIFRETKHSDE
jgi:hypothetical protein